MTRLVAEKVFQSSFVVLLVLLTLLVAGCAVRPVSKQMETTAYCGCDQCCGWERASWRFLKLDFWNRYVSAGRCKGADYSGKTARGTEPVEPKPGLLSTDSLTHPWMIPVRIVFPWLWLQRDGTIAADTQYYPFGTRLYIPGYGYGVVEDRGGVIKGMDRLDAFFTCYQKALAIDTLQHNIPNESLNHTALSYNFLKLNRHDEALYHLNEAEKLLPQINDKQREIEVMLGFIYYYLETENLEKAKNYIDRIVDYKNQNEFVKLAVEINYVGGRYYLKKKDYRKAIN